MDERSFGERVASLRSTQSLTLQQLGNILGLTKAAVGNLQHGRKKPSVDVLIAIADYFDVSLDYLVGRSDDPVRR